MRRIVAWASCILVSLPASGAGDELGRLFFSPEERAALDVQRRNAQPGKSVAAQTPVRIDGYAQSAAGRATLWVNGKPVAGGAALAGRWPGLKVGSALDPVSGQVTDLAEHGSISVRR